MMMTTFPDGGVGRCIESLNIAISGRRDLVHVNQILGSGSKSLELLSVSRHDPERRTLPVKYDPDDISLILDRSWYSPKLKRLVLEGFKTRLDDDDEDDDDNNDNGKSCMAPLGLKYLDRYGWTNRSGPSLEEEYFCEDYQESLLSTILMGARDLPELKEIVLNNYTFAKEP
ncbi:hypothetical protein BG004_008280 [Podila humilis]|nr:hypothetical protein BG004_008280 [Podila humilis]